MLKDNRSPVLFAKHPTDMEAEGSLVEPAQNSN